MIAERRQYIRLGVNIPFTYKVKGANKSREKTVTKNISPGGIGGAVNKRVKKSTLLELNIDIPTMKKPILALGKVMWTAGRKADKIDVGIKFEEIDSTMKTRFLEYICELMFLELERLRGDMLK